MGCGCRKNKSNTAAPAKIPLTTRQQQILRELSINRANKTLIDVKNKEKARQNLILANQRKSICESCPFATFNNQTSDNKFKVCTKCSGLKPIFIICSDFKFSCPIGKFKAQK